MEEQTDRTAFESGDSGYGTGAVADWPTGARKLSVKNLAEE